MPEESNVYIHREIDIDIEIDIDMDIDVWAYLICINKVLPKLYILYLVVKSGFSCF